MINYRQSGRENYLATALTPRIGYQHYLGRSRKPNWSLGMSGFFNTMLLKSNLSPISAKYLGLNASLIRNFHQDVSGFLANWSFLVGIGVHYNTMLVTHRAFGYRNLLGPQACFAAGRSWSDGIWISSTFLKLSSIMDGTKLLRFKNREVTGGLNVIFPKKRGARFSVGVDMTYLELDTQKTKIRSQIINGSLSYSW